VRHLTAEMLRIHKTGEDVDEHPDPEVRIAQKLEEVCIVPDLECFQQSVWYF